MNEIRLIVCGGRDFNHYKLMDVKLRRFYELAAANNSKVVELLHGNAMGADTIASHWHSTNKPAVEISMFPPNYEKYGKRAPLIRNTGMASLATHCLAFWNGKSKGTKHMIELGPLYDLKVGIIHYNMDEPANHENLCAEVVIRDTAITNSLIDITTFAGYE